MNTPPYESEAVVVIVDDDPSVRVALGRLLRAEGFEVQTHASAGEFLDAYGGRAGAGLDLPDCVILDIHLGAMSGFELHDRIIAARPALPVILMTAHEDASSAELSRRAGLHGYLRKPFASDALLALVHAALRRRVRARCIESAVAISE